MHWKRGNRNRRTYGSEWKIDVSMGMSEKSKRKGPKRNVHASLIIEDSIIAYAVHCAQNKWPFCTFLAQNDDYRETKASENVDERRMKTIGVNFHAFSQVAMHRIYDEIYVQRTMQTNMNKDECVNIAHFTCHVNKFVFILKFYRWIS